MLSKFVLDLVVVLIRNVETELQILNFMQEKLVFWNTLIYSW